MSDNPRTTHPAATLSAATTGKDMAEQFLQTAGIEIVCRDWQCSYGGLDLVTRDAGTTAFVTVITSAEPGGDKATELLSRTERQRIRRLALLWLTDQDGPWQRIRFDVVSVVARPDGAPQIEHHKAVF